MKKTNSIQFFEVKETLLLPYNKVLKIVGIPFCGFFGFVIFVFMSGLTGHKYYSQKPALLELGMPIWMILILILLFFTSIYLIIHFYRLQDVDPTSRISFQEDIIEVDTNDYLITFKIDKAKSIQFSESIVFQFFYKYYIVGRLKVVYEGDRYFFYFPVKNPLIENQIKSQIEK